MELKKPRRFRLPSPALEYQRAQRIARARMLDRLADQELQAGHHHTAEHLARRAADLRADAR